MDVPRNLLSLYDEVMMPLYVSHFNGQSLAESVSHKIRFITSIPTDGAQNKMLVKSADGMLQFFCKFRFHVVKLHCENNSNL